MDGFERIATTLRFREPDRVPLDIGGTSVTGIAVAALRRLLADRGIESKITVPDQVQQVGVPSAAALRSLRVDTARIGPPRIRDFDQHEQELEGTVRITDPWGVAWEHKTGEHYFSQVSRPLEDAAGLDEALGGYEPPDPPSADLLQNIVKDSPTDRSAFPILDRDTAGIFEMSCRLRGLETLCMELLFEPASCERLADIILEYKMAYWDRLLEAFGEGQVVVAEADDFGSDSSLLIDPALIRRLYLPRWRELFSFIKRRNPAARIFFHSCGAIRAIIPDLIEAGVHILNPVQYTAHGMVPAELKAQFGRDLVFWGGGIDTKQILPFGSPAEVRDEVRRIIDLMAPGGGFVFATVHNIQADVPPANLEALLQALDDYGAY